MPSYRHLFGPVASRRFGRSLGVDLVRSKTCSLDCVFCQLGPTPATTVERRADVPVAEVLGELAAWRQDGGRADVITLGGSGEPTLHPEFGAVLDWVRANDVGRSLLLSNGSLFADPAVRRDAARADIVKVSLHAWDAASFARVSRPHPALEFAAILDGYRAFRAAFAGTLAVEVFLVPGVNDAPEQVARIAVLCATFRPDRVDLNSAVRPVAEAGVRACPPEVLRARAALFSPPAEVPDYAAAHRAPPPAAETDDARIVALVARHPDRVSRLSLALGVPEPELLARLQVLAAAGRVSLRQVDGEWVAGVENWR